MLRFKNPGLRWQHLVLEDFGHQLMSATGHVSKDLNTAFRQNKMLTGYYRVRLGGYAFVIVTDYSDSAGMVGRMMLPAFSVIDQSRQAGRHYNENNEVKDPDGRYYLMRYRMFNRSSSPFRGKRNDDDLPQDIANIWRKLHELR